MIVVVTFLLPIPFCAGEETGANGTKSTFIPSSHKKLFSGEKGVSSDIDNSFFAKFGLILVPIVISEPAIGYGGGLNLMLIHKSHESVVERRSPPSVSGLVGVMTENGTFAGGVYHLGYWKWKDDSIRTTTAIGIADININFYLRDVPVDTNLRASFIYQEVLFRIGKSNFFGGNYGYAKIRTKLNTGTDFDLISFFENVYKIGALGVFIRLIPAIVFLLLQNVCLRSLL